MFRITIMCALAVVMLAACAPAPTPAPTAAPPTVAPSPTTAKALEKMTAAWVAITGNQAPAWLAKEGGIFTKYGLDVDLSFIQGSATATQSMIAGSTNVVQMAGPAAVNATN